MGKKLPEVVSAMGTAFDTTTIALGVAMTTMFLLFVAERTEEGIGRQVTAWAERELAHRFVAQEAQLTPFLGTLESAANATFSAVQQMVMQQLQAFSEVQERYEEQNRQRQQQIEQWAVALERQEQRHESLDVQGEERLERFFATLGNQHGAYMPRSSFVSLYGSLFVLECRYVHAKRLSAIARSGFGRRTPVGSD